MALSVWPTGEEARLAVPAGLILESELMLPEEVPAGWLQQADDSGVPPGRSGGSVGFGGILFPLLF